MLNKLLELLKEKNVHTFRILYSKFRKKTAETLFRMAGEHKLNPLEMYEVHELNEIQGAFEETKNTTRSKDSELDFSCLLTTPKLIS